MKKITAFWAVVTAFIILLHTFTVSAAGGSLSASTGIKIGENTEITFSLSAPEPMYAYEFYIRYDSTALELVSCSSAYGIKERRIYVADSSGGATETAGTVTFKALKAGNTTVYLEDCNFVDLDLNTEPLSGNDISVCVHTGVIGDANFDGTLNILDALRLKKYICGISSDINISGADINGDGSINSADLVAMQKSMIE